MATSGSRPNRANSISSPVVIFALAGLASMLLIGLGMVSIARGDAETAAIRDARDVTVANGKAAIEPILRDEFLEGDPAAVSEVDRMVRRFVLSQRLVRVKIWALDGTVLYSDDPALIGQRFALSDEDRSAFSGAPEAELSDLSRPENLGEREFDKLLEVYTGLRTPNGTPVLFEAYLRYSSVQASGAQIIRSILPPMLGGLALLFLIQLPLAFALTRRIAQGQREREVLLERALVAGDEERRRIAADLHDGVVQNLAGISYSLAAMAAEAKNSGADDLAMRSDDASHRLRQNLRELRTMIIAIAPPKLHEEGLTSALSDVASSLEANGIGVSMNVQTSGPLPAEAERLLYRACREALLNAQKHSSASEVTVTVVEENDGRLLRCSIRDNGRGFSPEEQLRRRREGHVGLHLLEDLLVSAGGSLKVVSGAEGTTIEVQVPAR